MVDKLFLVLVCQLLQVVKLGDIDGMNLLPRNGYMGKERKVV